MSDLWPREMDDLLLKINDETCEKLRQAVAIGKWENGQKLTTRQLEDAMQLIIAYEHRYLAPQQRTAYIEEPCRKDNHSRTQETALEFRKPPARET